MIYLPSCMMTEHQHPNSQSHARRALVLYGSQTGNSQEVAEDLGRMAERLHFITRVCEMDLLDLVCLMPSNPHILTTHARIDPFGLFMYNRTRSPSTPSSFSPCRQRARGNSHEMLDNSGKASLRKDCPPGVSVTWSSPPLDLEIVHTQSENLKHFYYHLRVFN